MYAKEYNDDELNSIGVYRIITPSGGMYIGMTSVSFKERWNNHFRDLKSDKHPTIALKNAYKKYNNWNLFTLEILELWNKPVEQYELLSIEKEILLEEKLAWIRHKNTGYSMIHGCPTGTGSVIHSEETRRKIGQSYHNNIKNQIKNGGPIPKNIILDHELELIKIDYENGLAINEIAKKYNKDHKTINLKAKEQKYTRPEKRFASYNTTLNKWPIKEWYCKEGKTITEIANLTGYSAVHIWRLLNYLKLNNEILENSLRKERAYKKSAENLKNKPKINCCYCDRLISPVAIKKHEVVCFKNPAVIEKHALTINICALPECGEETSSNKSKTCKKHNGLVRNKRIISDEKRIDSNKQKSYTFHINNHINMNFIRPNCDHCINSGLNFTHPEFTQLSLEKEYCLGASINNLAKKYHMNKTLMKLYLNVWNIIKQ